MFMFMRVLIFHMVNIDVPACVGAPKFDTQLTKTSLTSSPYMLLQIAQFLQNQHHGYEAKVTLCGNVTKLGSLLTCPKSNFDSRVENFSHI